MPLMSRTRTVLSAEDHRPVVTLATKHVDVRIRLRRRVRRGARRPPLAKPTAPLRSHRESRGRRRAPSTARCSLPPAWYASARPMRASAASYGAPTSFQSCTASEKDCSAPAASSSASRTLPRASAAPATSALLSNRAATSSSSSAADRARPMSPAAISISTCASSSGARCNALFGGRSFDGTRTGRSSASRMDATAVAASPCARRTRASPGWGSHPAR